MAGFILDDNIMPWLISGSTGCIEIQVINQAAMIIFNCGIS